MGQPRSVHVFRALATQANAGNRQEFDCKALGAREEGARRQATMHRCAAPPPSRQKLLTSQPRSGLSDHASAKAKHHRPFARQLAACGRADVRAYVSASFVPLSITLLVPPPASRSASAHARRARRATTVRQRRLYGAAAAGATHGWRWCFPCCSRSHGAGWVAAPPAAASQRCVARAHV